MSNEDLNVKLSADDKGLQSGLDGASASVQAAVAKIEQSLNAFATGLDSIKKRMEGVNNTPLKPGGAGGSGGKETLGLLDQMKGKLDSVQGGVVGVIGKFNALTAAVAAIAAGGAFKNFIDSYISEASDVGKLANRLSITTVEASHLNVALQLVGSSADDYLRASTMLNRQLKTNADYMQQLGIHTTGASGKQLSQNEIMQSALKTLESYAAGYDRNQASMAMFGRGADEVQKLLKINNEVMEKARTLAKAYGNEFDKGAITQTREFKVAVSTVTFALEQFGQAIGEKLMPYVQRTAEWLTNEGPAAFAVFKQGVDIVMDVWDTLSGVVSEVFGLLTSAAKDFVQSLGFTSSSSLTIMQVIKNAFGLLEVAVLVIKSAFVTMFETVVGVALIWEGRIVGTAKAVWTYLTTRDLSKAKAAYTDYYKDVEARAAQHFKNMVGVAMDSQKRISDILQGNTKAPEAKAPTEPEKKGGRKFTAKEKTDSNEDILKAQLAVEKAQIEASLAMKRQLLSEEAATNENALKQNLLDLTAYYAEKLRIETDALNSEKDAKQKELANAVAAENNPKVKSEKERLLLTAQRIKLEGEVAVLEEKISNSGIQNARERIAAEKQLNDQLANIRLKAVEDAANAEIEVDRQLLKQREALALVSKDQVIKAEAELEDRRYAIQVKGLQDRLALAALDPVKRADINAQIEKAEIDHQAKMLGFAIETQNHTSKYVVQSINDTRSAMENMFESVFTRTKSIGGAIRDFFNDVNKSILKSISQNLTDKIMTSLQGGQNGGKGILGSLFGGLFGGGGSTSKNGMPIDGAKNAIRVTSVDGGLGGGEEAPAKMESIFDRVTDSLSTVFNDIKASLSNVFSSLSNTLGSVFSSMGSSMGGGGGGIGSILGSFLGSVASFDVGTDSVPRDMLALVHAGERITPTKYTGRGDGQTVSVQNHFTVQGNVDARTQEQIARQAGAAIQRATARFA